MNDERKRTLAGRFLTGAFLALGTVGAFGAVLSVPKAEPPAVYRVFQDIGGEWHHVDEWERLDSCPFVGVEGYVIIREQRVQ